MHVPSEPNFQQENHVKVPSTVQVHILVQVIGEAVEQLVACAAVDKKNSFIDFDPCISAQPKDAHLHKEFHILCVLRGGGGKLVGVYRGVVQGEVFRGNYGVSNQILE